MKNKVTIYDISERLNISASTVSRALNNNPKISANTRLLVSKTAHKMGYKRNRLAQALQSGESKTIGVIVPYISHHFFSLVIRGIEEKLAPHGYQVIICQTHENHRVEIEKINMLIDTQVDAIFISISKPTAENTKHIEKVISNGTPIFFFDRKIDLPKAYSVTLNDFKAGYIATEHLIKQGCKNIAHLSGNTELQIYKNRQDGYLQALKDHKLKVRPEFIIQANSNIESGKKAIENLFSQNKKPDAIFSASDYSALGAVQELKKKGLKIPEDVCVVGFSNEPFTNYLELPISTIDQTPLSMGEETAQIFLHQLTKKRKPSDEKKQVVLSPKLILRESSNRKSPRPFLRNL